MTDPTGTRVTAADIARSIGVSRATVGLVLNNTPGQAISERIRHRVLAEAERMGYRPNHAAQTLADGRGRVILIVLPDWPMQFNTYRALEAACEVLDKAGYRPVVHAKHAAGPARPLWKLLNPEVVIGLGLFRADDLDAMRASGITKILPDPARHANLGLTMLTAGPQSQVRHLFDRGHRRLAFAGSPEPRLSFRNDARAKAMRAAAVQLGLDTPDVRAADYRDGTAETAVRDWHAAGVTGVVAFDDHVAACVVGAALRAGLTLPGDIAVIGHGDSPIAAMYVPAISTVDVDYEGMARYLAELALHEADPRLPRPPEFAPATTLHPRETT